MQAVAFAHILGSWLVGKFLTATERTRFSDCNGAYAGKPGTPYRDWHTSPRKAPMTPCFDGR